MSGHGTRKPPFHPEHPVMNHIHVDLSGGIDPASLVVIAASWFGSGLLEPFRAGLAVVSAVPLAFLMRRFGGPVHVALLVTLSLIGFASSNAWEDLYAIADDRRIVIDEVAGFLTGLFVIGPLGWRGLLLWAVVFLAADKMKPWPIDHLEAIPGGTGVMLDDVVLALVVALGWRACVSVRPGRFVDGSWRGADQRAASSNPSPRKTPIHRDPDRDRLL